MSILFSALILAPVIEEFIFRGFFTKNKGLKIISIIGIPAIILIMQNYYILIIGIPYVILLLIDLYKVNAVNKNILFVFGTLVFALAHYQLEHFQNLITIIPIIGQFAIGLLLIWIVINFSIKKAIITHFLFNLLLLSPMFFELQFPNLDTHELEHNNYKILWQKTPILKGMRIFSKPHPFEVNATNFTPLDVYLSYDVDNKPNLRNAEMFNKYKISIKKTNETAVKLDSTLVKAILLKAELLIDD